MRKSHIDKPFASTWRDGKAMIDIAEETGTPFLACSILRHVPEVEHFKASWARLADEPGLAIVKGLGSHNGAVIHGLSFMQELFGTGIEWLECMGDLPREIMHLHYRSGLQVIVLNTPSQTYDWFRCEVYSRTQRVNPPARIFAQSQPVGDIDFLPGALNILKLYRQMLDTRKPPEPYDIPLELATVLEASLQAHETRQRVHLDAFIAQQSS